MSDLTGMPERMDAQAELTTLRWVAIHLVESHDRHQAQLAEAWPTLGLPTVCGCPLCRQARPWVGLIHQNSTLADTQKGAGPMGGVCNDCHNHPCVCGMDQAGGLGDFYDWLRTQFSDLESAKVWGRKWFNEMEQKTPFGECTARAMAYHINQALAGRKHSDEAGAFTVYAETEHGSEIVNAIWGEC